MYVLAYFWKIFVFLANFGWDNGLTVTWKSFIVSVNITNYYNKLLLSLHYALPVYLSDAIERVQKRVYSLLYKAKYELCG